MARFAVDRGWGIDVVTLEPMPLAAKELRALEELPPGMSLYGVRQPRLFRERAEHLAWRLYDRLRSRRRNPPVSPPATARPAAGPASAPVPQEQGWRWTSPVHWKRAYYAWLETARDRAWATRAAACAGALAGAHRYECLVSCGPPHLIHWAGQRVAAEAGIPFVMDLRDPWSLVERVPEHYDSPVWFRLAQRYERQAVSGASLVVMNTERAAQAMCQTYPGCADRIMSAMNGYDEDEPVPPSSRSTRFLMVFAGSIYIDRNPVLLLRAASRVARELGLTGQDFRIEFVGNVGSTDPDDPTSILALARMEGVADHVGVSGFRPRRELAALLAQATVLVSLYQDSQMCVPSKIFESMQYDAWILTFAETGSATELLLRGTDADVLDPQAVDQLVHTLIRRYRQFAAGERPVRLARDDRFSRRVQATMLFERIEALSPGRPDPPAAWSARANPYTDYA
jgi:Glycosyl transferases group 1